MLCNSSDEYCCSWVLGDALCKMYQFVHSLSYTASIFILVVISTERYFAIIHPIKCKQILTPRRLVVSRSRYLEQCSLMLAKRRSLVRQGISVDGNQAANPTAEAVTKPSFIIAAVRARRRTTPKTRSIQSTLLFPISRTHILILSPNWHLCLPTRILLASEIHAFSRLSQTFHIPRSF